MGGQSVTGPVQAGYLSRRLSLCLLNSSCPSAPSPAALPPLQAGARRHAAPLALEGAADGLPRSPSLWPRRCRPPPPRHPTLPRLWRFLRAPPGQRGSPGGSRIRCVCPHAAGVWPRREAGAALRTGAAPGGGFGSRWAPLPPAPSCLTPFPSAATPNFAPACVFLSPPCPPARPALPAPALPACSRPASFRHLAALLPPLLPCCPACRTCGATSWLTLCCRWRAAPWWWRATASAASSRPPWRQTTPASWMASS